MGRFTSGDHRSNNTSDEYQQVFYVAETALMEGEKWISDNYLGHWYDNNEITGNANADGAFVYTGFRPAWILTKNTADAEWWTLIDNKRLGYNETNSILSPNDVAAEYAAGAGGFDIVSNGFKVRGTSGNFNGSGDNHIYIAFADQPFKYSNAR